MTEKLHRRGLMLVLSSPSGAGKTTLSRLLLEADKDISLSISATTRVRRPNEREGVDYYFVDGIEFERRIGDGEFLEHAQVFGNRYGTPRAVVSEAIAAGRDILFDIDWQGAQQLKAKMRDDLVSVFILPPSHDELERRLKNRAQDTDEVVAARMARAADEISHWAEYDYIVINSDVRKALDEIKAILVAERLRRSRQVGIPGFVEALTH